MERHQTRRPVRHVELGVHIHDRPDEPFGQDIVHRSCVVSRGHTHRDAGLIGNSTFEIPIVGGTGGYAGANGYVHVRQLGSDNNDNSAATFVITG